MLATVSQLGLKVVQWGDKTTSSTVGQQKFTSLTISILKLAGVLFPAYAKLYQPALESLCGYRNLCSSTVILPTLGKMVEAKRITVQGVFQLVTSLSLAVHFLQQVDLLPLRHSAQLSQQLGASKSSFIHAAWQLICRNPRQTWIVMGSTFCLANLMVGYYQAKNPDERAKALSVEKCLLFASQGSKLLIICLSGCQAPLLLACLDVGSKVASYGRFLVSCN